MARNLLSVFKYVAILSVVSVLTASCSSSSIDAKEESGNSSTQQTVNENTSASEDTKDLNAILEKQRAEEALEKERAHETKLSYQRAQSALESDFDKFVLEKNYTTSTILLPRSCRLKNRVKLCMGVAEYFSQSFERQQVIAQNEAIDFENPEFSKKSMAYQQVRVVMLDSVAVLGVKNLYAVIKQQLPGKEETRSIYAYNYTLDKDDDIKTLTFDELFENPELAKMLIARAIERDYGKYNTRLLPIVIAQVEIRPVNFILTKDGLVFFFAPGQIDPTTKDFDLFRISIKELERAKPVHYWWPLVFADSKGKAPVLPAWQQELYKADYRQKKEAIANIEKKKVTVQQQKKHRASGK